VVDSVCGVERSDRKWKSDVVVKTDRKQRRQREKKSKAFDGNSTRSYVLMFYILRIHDIDDGNGCEHITLFVRWAICAVGKRNR